MVQRRQEDNGKLQALGVVHGHDLNGVFRVLARFRFRLLRTGGLPFAEPLDELPKTEVARVMEASRQLGKLSNASGFLGAVGLRQRESLVARLPKNAPDEQIRGDAVRTLPPSGEPLDESAQPFPIFSGNDDFSSQRIRQVPNIEFQSQERFVRDANQRRAQHRRETDLIPRIRDHLEQAHEVAHFPRLEKSRAPGDLTRNRRLAQVLIEFPDQVVGAHEDGEIPPSGYSCRVPDPQPATQFHNSRSDVPRFSLPSNRFLAMANDGHFDARIVFRR